MRIRVKEIAFALDVDPSDVIAVCTLLDLPVNSNISSLSIEEAKKVTDYYEDHLKI